MLEASHAVLDDDLQPLPAVTRQHGIVLCCAQSVAELVEEVARNLVGLGFAVQVVCGAEARTVLLGSGRDRNAPTIYVVCVQGTLKEQVLKPLRQALATHGGPNQHLFVAVLDLGLPLAMVGQIRRFAEALERPHGRRSEGSHERRQWREQLGPQADRVATRSYRTVTVTAPGHTEVPAERPSRSGPQAVIGSARMVRVGVTAKYRAVTGQLPSSTAAAAEDNSTPSKRRRVHAPKVKVKPIAVAPKQRRATPPQVSAATTVEPAPASGVPTPTPLGHTPSVPMVATTPRSMSAPHPAVAPARTGSRAPWAILAGVSLVAIAALAVWMLGLRDDGNTSPTRPLPASVSAATPPAPTTPVERTSTHAATAPAMPARAPAPPPEPTVEAPAPAPTEPTPMPVAEPTPAPAAAPTPAAAEPDAPVAAPPGDSEPPAAAELPAAAHDTVFAAALAARRLRATSRLYVTTSHASARSWSEARAWCDALVIDGTAGFRLPYRRELQLLDAIGALTDEPHWSRTVPDDDATSAFVIHPSTGQLSAWLREEAAAAVCVHDR